MFTVPEIVVLVLIATLGHAMALVWYLAVRNEWGISSPSISFPMTTGHGASRGVASVG